MSSYVFALIISFCGSNHNCAIWFEQCINRTVFVMNDEYVNSYPFVDIQEEAFNICKDKSKVVQF